MKKVVIYSNQHAESVVSAAKVMVENPDAIAVLSSDNESLSKLLKGKDNEVYVFVDEMDERHLKGDNVHYITKAKEEGVRRAVEMYGDSKIPYVVNVIADHNHNQDTEVYKAAILADYSDLSENKTVNAWKVLFSDNLNAIEVLKSTGAPIARYLKNIDAVELVDNSEELKEFKGKAEYVLEATKEKAEELLKAVKKDHAITIKDLKAKHKESLAKKKK